MTIAREGIRGKAPGYFARPHLSTTPLARLVHALACAKQEAWKEKYG